MLFEKVLDNSRAFEEFKCKASISRLISLI